MTYRASVWYVAVVEAWSHECSPMALDFDDDMDGKIPCDWSNFDLKCCAIVYAEFVVVVMVVEIGA